MAGGCKRCNIHGVDSKTVLLVSSLILLARIKEAGIDVRLCDVGEAIQVHKGGSGCCGSGLTNLSGSYGIIRVCH